MYRVNEGRKIENSTINLSPRVGAAAACKVEGIVPSTKSVEYFHTCCELISSKTLCTNPTCCMCDVVALP